MAMSHTHIEHHQQAPGWNTSSITRISADPSELAFLHVIRGYHECILVCCYDFTIQSLEKSSFCLRIWAYVLWSKSISKPILVVQSHPISIEYSLWVVFSPTDIISLSHVCYSLFMCLIFFLYISWVSVYWVKFSDLQNKNSFGQKRTADHCITCSNTSFVNSLSFSSHQMPCMLRHVNSPPVLVGFHRKGGRSQWWRWCNVIRTGIDGLGAWAIPYAKMKLLPIEVYS